MSDAPEGAWPPPRAADAPAPARGPVKGPAAFRTISEASADVGVPQHVLRFWETRFAFIRPTKRAGGRRFYRPQDLDVLRGVRTLLQDEGYTIKGVQKLHKEGGLKRLLAASGLGEADAVRLSSEVEAGAVEAQPVPPLRPAALPETPAEASSVLPTRGDGDEAGVDTETLDLFGAPPASAPASPPARPASSPPPAAAERPVLDAAARSRLSEVLDDLESVKAEIDALLAGG